MKRISKLVRATEQAIKQQSYQEGLQAMWEDRWVLLGPNGKDEWLRRHGELPPRDCPLVASPLLHAVRRILDGRPDKPYGALRRRIRRNL